MKYTFIPNNETYSKVVSEEFIPIKIVFSDIELNNKYISFRFKDSELLEFSVNPETYELKKFVFTLCNNYSISDTSLTLPDYISGSILITGPEENVCSKFSTTVYTNCIEISLSNNPAICNYRTGNLIFAFDEADNICKLYVCDLKPDELNHIKTELACK